MAARPDDPVPLRRLAEARLRQGQADLARELLQQAERLAPGDPGQGLAWQAFGEAVAGSAPGEAVEAFGRAAALRPGDPRPASLLAGVLTRLGRHEEAIAAYRAVVAASPGVADLLNNVGVALDGLGRREDAVSVLRTAALLNPESPSTHDNLGNALLAVGNARQAEAAHRRALALGAKGALTFSNLGNALHRQGRLAEAEAAYRRAIELAPELAKLHTNLALTLLLEGKCAEGWREYEWRWRDHPGFPAYLREKRWQGEDMPEGTLLLQAEQGYGDTIQFVRYAPLVRQRVKRVILACQPELVRLMRTARGLDEVVAESGPVPEFDAALTLMSLPGLFGTDQSTVPGGVPYLGRPAGSGAPLPEGGGLKVAIVWAGRPTHGDDWNRSVPARLWEPLLAVPGTSFYSLQRGAVAERLGRPPADRVHQVGDLCADFADTAAVLAAMDLVISVDTAVVHLAGAMGKPVWVLLPPVPDFRWLMSGETTPWYPSMRLFRKGFDSGWEPVIAEVACLLREMAARET